MIHIDYPEPRFRIKTKDNKQYIFDEIRKIWLLLNPEEWVRQNFINYLVVHLKYPSTVIALEKELLLNDLKKRFDVLIYNKQHEPWMLVECKAPAINLDEKVLQQVLRYNITIPVFFIILTNGNSTIGWKKENGELIMLNEMPEWC
jgi:hypothetical protein